LDRQSARQKLGLQADVTTMLVMGGSQGASGINQAIIKSLPLLRDAALQVIHLSGTRDESFVADNYRRERMPAYVAAFHHHMEEVYSAADFAAARAGAASLAEIASFELPSILIPFPYAADDHQTCNAEIFARAGAAFVLKESELTPELLTQKIREMSDRPEQLQPPADEGNPQEFTLQHPDLRRENEERRHGFPCRGVIAHHDVVPRRNAFAAFDYEGEAAQALEHPKQDPRPAARDGELRAIRQPETKRHHGSEQACRCHHVSGENQRPKELHGVGSPRQAR